MVLEPCWFVCLRFNCTSRLHWAMCSRAWLRSASPRCGRDPSADECSCSLSLSLSYIASPSLLKKYVTRRQQTCGNFTKLRILWSLECWDVWLATQSKGFGGTSCCHSPRVLCRFCRLRRDSRVSEVYDSRRRAILLRLPLMVRK